MYMVSGRTHLVVRLGRGAIDQLHKHLGKEVADIVRTVVLPLSLAPS